MNILTQLRRIKLQLEDSITTATFNEKNYENGNQAKIALIRSQKLINYLHEFIKSEFIRHKVNPKKIFPHLGETKPEINLQGFLKSKKQDIYIAHEDATIGHETEAEKHITVNIRSQLSSLKKNIDTLYERTFAEPLNLHLKYPKLCLGEVYLIPTHEYNDQEAMKNRIAFKEPTQVERYINLFQQINNRTNCTKDEYKYERVCLLVVDFRPRTPKLYNTIEELINEGLISKASKANMTNLNIRDFVPDLLNIYSQRFDLKLLR